MCIRDSKQTIDRCIITAKDYDEFLKLMQEAGYEIKTGKYISFRAEGQERFTRAKTIGDNYTCLLYTSLSSAFFLVHTANFLIKCPL